jgi:oxygen-independent coproporphyrinogen-3 oxidase
MCKGETSWKGDQYLSPAIQKGIKACEELERDGLVILLPCKLIVTERGKAFLRNICACFDAYLQSAPQQNTPVFSTAV